MALKHLSLCSVDIGKILGGSVPKFEYLEEKQAMARCVFMFLVMCICNNVYASIFFPFWNK